MYHGRPPEPNNYRIEIINMIKYQNVVTHPPSISSDMDIPTAAVYRDTSHESNGSRRSSWDAERSVLSERGQNNGGGGGGMHHETTPWISEFHLRGMQRSAIVDRSELTNILKLELFSPPSKRNESRAQRQRRLDRESFCSDDESSPMAQRQPRGFG